MVEFQRDFMKSRTSMVQACIKVTASLIKTEFSITLIYSYFDTFLPEVDRSTGSGIIDAGPLRNVP